MSIVAVGVNLSPFAVWAAGKVAAHARHAARRAMPRVLIGGCVTRVAPELRQAELRCHTRFRGAVAACCAGLEIGRMFDPGRVGAQPMTGECSSFARSPS